MFMDAVCKARTRGILYQEHGNTMAGPHRSEANLRRPLRPSVEPSSEHQQPPANLWLAARRQTFLGHGIEALAYLSGAVDGVSRPHGTLSAEGGENDATPIPYIRLVAKYPERLRLLGRPSWRRIGLVYPSLGRRLSVRSWWTSQNPSHANGHQSARQWSDQIDPPAVPVAPDEFRPK
jgi:hypothetical protein